MPRPITTSAECSVCRQQYPKTHLRVKRCQFKEFGKGGRILRSRDVAYLCIPCMQEDPDYKQPAYASLQAEV